MPTNVQSRKANYIVKGVETVVAGRDIQARIFTLAPGEIIPWHSHSEITDCFFVLSGRLSSRRVRLTITMLLALGEAPRPPGRARLYRTTLRL